MQANNKNKPDGMPTIAEVVKSKPLGLVAVALVVVAVIAFSLISTKSKEQVNPVKEEVYQVEGDAASDMQAGQNALLPVKPMSKQDEDERRTISAAEISVMAEQQKELQQRLMAPLMVVNNNASENPAESVGEAKKEKSANPNTRFMEEASAREAKPARATSIGALSAIIAEGSFLHAILEPATDSDLPGYLRATISEPAYSEDGSRVLVPRGSRLVGEYKSGILQGQSRVSVVWTRLITPAGVSIQLGSAGVDSLGVSGMAADSINRHFWERFGMASLLSIIGAGAANVGVSGNDADNSASTYRNALAGSFSQSANDSLQQDSAIAPTLKTNQGKPIMVFVAHDLQFADAIKQVTPSVNVF